MRLSVVAFAALAFAQPALAREHIHHRHSTRGVLSHHQLVRASARHAWRSAAWRSHGQWARGEGVEPSGAFAQGGDGHGALDAMIARHAQTNGVPEALVHRVVIRESRYNAHIVGAGGAMGLMQIKLGTARAMGYTGTAAGLLDPETNLTYAVRYLAGAYRVAGGNADRAVANYARGYRDGAVREGAASARAAASAETSGWSGSYASAAPVERVVWAHSHGRRHAMRSH
jgi:transglycosylase-like protein with SLT domain